MADNPHQAADVVVVSQLPPPVHGSTLMTRTFLSALDSQSISWRLVDRRFSKQVGEVGKFSLAKVVRGLGLILRLVSVVTRRPPRVVVLFATTRSFSFLVDWLISEVLRVLRVPVILYLHTVGFSELADRGRCWRHAVRRLFGSAKATVILGESLAWDVEPFIQGQADVIGNTLPELPPAVAVNVPLHARDTVLFLSNLVPGKGHDDFLAIAVQCLEQGIDAKFVLAGAASPSVAADVNATIAGSGWASHISYLGAVDAQEKWQLLANARAFVFPSKREAFPLVLLEAAVCGVPIATYHTSALAPSLAIANAACVVDTGNRDLLAAAIRQILDSADIGAKLGARAQALIAESFSHAAYGNAWGQLLDRFGVPRHRDESSS